MRKLLATLLLAGFAALGLNAQNRYYTVEEMPDMVVILPAPPEEGSARFEYDKERYRWGKEQRKDADRAAMAIRDANYSLETICNEYSEAFGLQISKEGTPKIYELLADATSTCALVTRKAKKHYMRTRPFAYFNEATLVPKDEEVLRSNGSYPSGHTTFGWTSALVLSEINPAAQNELLVRGYKYGESRVIAGFHWQSDVDAAYIAAGLAYARLHDHPRFLRQMKAAQREFRRKVLRP